MRFVTNPSSLLIILVRVVIHHVEESKLVHAFGSRHHAQPVPQLLLLEELLRPSRAQKTVSVDSHKPKYLPLVLRMV